MSETGPASPPAAERRPGRSAARVWQAIDLLHPPLATNGFFGLHRAPLPLFARTDFALPIADGADTQACQVDDASQSASAQETLTLTGSETSELLAPDMAQALELARSEAHAQGMAQARAELQAAMEDSLQARLASDRSLVQEVQAALTLLKQNPQVLYEPLKRLALHLAEQLVLAELSLDNKAIERLVRACTDELVQHGESMVEVELHSSDLAAWHELGQRAGLATPAGVRMLANDILPRGSVRARANDTLVEDLIVNRLAGLARVLGVSESRWQANSAFNTQARPGESLRPQSGPALPGQPAIATGLERLEEPGDGPAGEPLNPGTDRD